MNALIAIAGAAALFVIFGLFRRGREPEKCAGCGGECDSGADCHLTPSTPGRSADARH